MRWLLGLIIFVTWPSIISVGRASSPWDTGVLEIHPNNLTNHLLRNPSSLVLFYVTWCPWCRRLLPIWKKIHEFVADDVKCVQVRMDRASPMIQDLYDVRAYPKLVWFDGNGKNSTFEQNRGDFNTLVQWVNDVSGKGNVISVKSMDELKLLLQGGQSQTIAIWTGNAAAKSTLESQKITDSLRNHLLTLKSSDNEVLEYVQKRLAHTPRALDKLQSLQKKTSGFLTLIHPFGNDLSESDLAASLSRENQPFPALDFLEEDEKIEHLPYSQDHVDHSAQIWDPATNIEEFIQTYMFPVITKWTADSASRILEMGRPFLVAIVPSKIPESLFEDLFEGIGAESIPSDLFDSELIENALWRVGTQYRSKFVTVHSGSRSLAERRLLQLLGTEPNAGISLSPILAYVTLNPTGSGVYAPALKYLAPDELTAKLFRARGAGSLDEGAVAETVAAMENWLERVRNGKIAPTIKSEEPLGKANNPGPVYHLTALEFGQEVLNARDVNYLVDFYAPWCGHCRVLAPLYEQAAQAFRQAGYKDVKFGKLDATANEVLGVPIRGYPTLILYRAGAKRSELVIMPTTPHTAEQIISFVARSCTREIDESLVIRQLSRLHAPDLPVLADEL